jgi:hypothetical protein
MVENGTGNASNVDIVAGIIHNVEKCSICVSIIILEIELTTKEDVLLI